MHSIKAAEPATSVKQVAHARLSELGDRQGRPAQILITVLYTTSTQTARAYGHALRLARELKGRIKLLVPQTVPYPLPLEAPSAEPETFAARLSLMLDGSEIDTTVEVRLCREPWEGIRTALPAGSIVVVGCDGRWWPCRAMRLARRLKRDGHLVLTAIG